MKRETRATRDERERRDGRDGWEHHVKEEPTGDIRSSKFRNPRTFDPDPSPCHARPASRALLFRIPVAEGDSTPLYCISHNYSGR